MKRKYKILLIVLISGILTYLIYFFNYDSRLNIVAIGDGIASGQTPYDIDGISYNDYIKEYYENKRSLKSYNNDYAKKNYKIKDLINDIEENEIYNEEELSIKQVMHNADLITICIGEEELSKLAITKDLTIDYLKSFIKEYDELLKILKEITEAKIIILGFYENMYLDKTNLIILNSEISNLALKYEANFIDISDLMIDKDYYLTESSFYFNYRAHKVIADMIIYS